MVSDLYQDWFQEGSFIGKGIYQVEAFEDALDDHFPENRILSHDLLEGCYARSGLLSDVQLYEDYPASYRADVSRRHRWMRGDWQIAQWLLPRVPGRDGRLRVNPLSALSRWKLADNLRRSLVPAALTALLVLGLVLVDQPGVWMLAVLGILLIPALLTAMLGALRKPGDLRWPAHLGAALRAAGQRMTQALFGLACLPYEAYFSLDTVLRTLWRLGVSHRNLLEWTCSGEPSGAEADSLWANYQRMWIAPALGLGAGAVLALRDPLALLVAAPLLLAWLAAPLLAWWLSRPLTARPAHLSVEQTGFLRHNARKTWAFFETVVGAEDHWLPPDNVQEHPVAAVAHRTSPTNMGLSLLANLAAYDFGYLPAGGLIARTGEALRTMAALPRHAGHFYNWYDTRSLEPLEPRYISSVDSGNLAGHLSTLQPGLLALIDAPILHPRWREGIVDSWQVLGDAPVLARFGQTLNAAGLTPPRSLSAARDCLVDLTALADAAVGEEASLGAQSLARHCRAVLDELLVLAADGEDKTWRGDLAMSLRQVAELEEGAADQPARARIRQIEQLAHTANELARLDYGLLFDDAQSLLAIGYRVAEHRRDDSYYDLLASEARLGCFVAIAQGQLPQESWFALGRLLTRAQGQTTLLSWSGSMFEYLMPLLVIPSEPNTLLDQTYRTAVVRSFMAHHQGMTLLALAHLLLDRPMQRRFAAVPSFQATALLLQERIPKTTAFYSDTHGEITSERASDGTLESPIRVLTTPNTPHPQVQLLSNGRYHVMVTNAGGGYSRWQDLAVTRWREDSTPRRFSPKGGPSSAAAIRASNPIPRSSSRPRMIWNCAACA